MHHTSPCLTVFGIAALITTGCLDTATEGETRLGLSSTELGLLQGARSELTIQDQCDASQGGRDLPGLPFICARDTLKRVGTVRTSDPQIARAAWIPELERLRVEGVAPGETTVAVDVTLEDGLGRALTETLRARVVVEAVTGEVTLQAVCGRAVRPETSSYLAGSTLALRIDTPRTQTHWNVPTDHTHFLSVTGEGAAQLSPGELTAQGDPTVVLPAQSTTLTMTTISGEVHELEVVTAAEITAAQAVREGDLYVLSATARRRGLCGWVPEGAGTLVVSTPAVCEVTTAPGEPGQPAWLALRGRQIGTCEATWRAGEGEMIPLTLEIKEL